jgi:hypothetical protein
MGQKLKFSYNNMYSTCCTNGLVSYITSSSATLTVMISKKVEKVLRKDLDKLDENIEMMFFLYYSLGELKPSQ